MTDTKRSDLAGDHHGDGAEVAGVGLESGAALDEEGHHAAGRRTRQVHIGGERLRRLEGATGGDLAVELGVVAGHERPHHHRRLEAPRPAFADRETYLADFCAEARKTWPANRTLNVVCHGHSVPAGYFNTPDVRTFAWEQRWGRLRQDLNVQNLDPPAFAERLNLMFDTPPCYMIFQMRQGLYAPRRSGDNDLFARLAEAPALYELAPARVGVRLLAVFNQDQFRAVWNRQTSLPSRRP